MSSNAHKPMSVEKAQKTLKFIQKLVKIKKVKCGINEATKCLNKGTALLIVIAEDPEPREITGFLPVICEDKGVPYVYVPSKIDLAAACGIKRPVVAAAVYCPKDMESLAIDEGVNELLRQ